MRGRDWNTAVSPTPKPTAPLTMNHQSEPPLKPPPQRCATRPSSSVPKSSRQKFAFIPPTRREEMLPLTAESENSTVVRNAGSMGGSW